jgi:hypothetical protein
MTKPAGRKKRTAKFRAFAGMPASVHLYIFVRFKKGRNH